MQTTAAYFDGLRPVAQEVSLSLANDGLLVTVAGGSPFLWRYENIRLAEDNVSPLRFHREQSGARTGELLELPADDFAVALKARCKALGGSHIEISRTRRKVFGWAAAAIISLLVIVFYGVPALATRLAPVVPWRTEVALGRAVEGEVLRSLTGGSAKICAADGPGKDALAKMVNTLTSHAVLPGAVNVRVIDTGVQNAFALPGGTIFLLRGLIEKAESVDEVAGVLAHELGHVANRDSMRGVIHAGGISFLVGTLLGDFTGAGAIVIASKFLLGNRYSRENESQADAFAIEVMTKAGGDVKALGRFLQRVAKTPGERQMELLLSHPVTDDRVAEIERQAPRGETRPILSPAEWQALKTICKA
ncbi:MAG: M48 family metallopeptidase [Beijerinckiaceae bacterium]